MKTIFASGTNQAKTDYKKCLELVKNSSWVSPQTFESLFNIAKETYLNESSFSLDGGHENISFSSYITQKINLYDKAH